MPSIEFRIQNDQYVGLDFTLTGVDNDITDAEAQDIADRIKGSDMVDRYLNYPGVVSIGYDGLVTVTTLRQFTP